MKRYTFALSRTFVDSDSLQSAIETAMKSGMLKITEGEIPQKIPLYCSVTPTPNPSGKYSASAKLQHKDGNLELIASVDAPSAERALFALGVNNPSAHTCNIFKRRFGTEYTLILGDPPAIKK